MTLLVAMGLMLNASAQDRSITGKVTDPNGNPLSGSSVSVTGSKVGAVTASDGTFSIKVPSGAKSITISSVGMADQTLTLNNRTNYSVTMSTTASDLSEVVVIGYGSGKRRENTPGSLTKVGGEAVENRPAANMLDALQGRVAGLQIYTSSGEPSATPSVRLHGVGSIGASNTPLYILDGTPVTPGTIVSLNPNDIQDITVLKDASATSIYGTRAANGVIMYTTKQGKVNAPRLTIDAQYGVSNLTSNSIDAFTRFMNTKELTDFWIATGFRTQAQVNTTLAQFPFDTKWYKTYYKEDIPTSQVNLSLSGGGGKTTYYVSGGYFQQEGLAYRSNYDRLTFRSNITSQVNNWMKFGMNISGGQDKRQTNPYGSNSTNRGLGLLAAPFYSPVDTNGVKYPNLIPGWGRYNPEYLANNIRGNSKNLQFNPSVFVQIVPVKGLIVKTAAGTDAYDFTTSNVQLPSFVGSLGNGNASEDFSRGHISTITNTAEYKFDVKKVHDITLLAGHEFITSKTTGFTASSTGQSDDRLLLLGAGPNNRNATSSASEYAFQSYFGRLGYGYSNKYFVDLTLRQDQSSRFGRDKGTASFWSAGLLWKVKKENFMSNVDWVNDLSFRASIGTSGNSPTGDYSNLATVGNGQYAGQTTFGIGQAGNPLLSWETQEKITIGIDATIFKKVNIVLDYYRRDTKDQLFSIPFPFTSGFSDVLSNAGSIRNSGIDLELSVDAYRTKNAYITPYVSLNYNKNEVTELFQDRDFWVVPNTGVSYVIGQPISYLYPLFAGVNPQNGNAEWYLPNTNPGQFVNEQKDPTKVTSVFNTAALQQGTGIQRFAPFNGGFGLNAGWRSFSLTTHFSFSQGKYLINNDRFFFENPTQFPGFNQNRDILDYWKQPGDVARFPRYGVQFTQFDDRLIEDASFMRLKALTIGYDLPKNILAKMKVIKGMNFSVTGRNLLTITNYTGQDPEIDTNVTLGANPNTKQFVFNVRFDF